MRNEFDRVHHRAERMGGSVCCCHRLPRAVSRKRSSRVACFHLPGRGMRAKRSTSYDRHPEYPGVRPLPENVDRFPGAGIIRDFVLEPGKKAFRAIRCPSAQVPMVVGMIENPEVLVFSHIPFLELVHDFRIMFRTGASPCVLHVPCDFLIESRMYGSGMFGMPFFISSAA